MAFPEEHICQVGFGHQGVGVFGSKDSRRIASASRDSFSASARRPSEERRPARLSMVRAVVWMFGPQHTLLGGQDFAIQLLGFREATLRLDDQCQIAHRCQSVEGDPVPRRGARHRAADDTLVQPRHSGPGSRAQCPGWLIDRNAWAFSGPSLRVPTSIASRASFSPSS